MPTIDVPLERVDKIARQLRLDPPGHSVVDADLFRRRQKPLANTSSSGKSGRLQ
jgi:hypothetical protein